MGSQGLDSSSDDGWKVINVVLVKRSVLRILTKKVGL